MIAYFSPPTVVISGAELKIFLLTVKPSLYSAYIILSETVCEPPIETGS